LAPTELNAADALPVAQEGARLARASGFDAEARVGVSGPTWQGIVDLADELGAPVIVIGSHGFSDLREAFEGSMSHDVVVHARRRVLVVPPPRAVS
jgi:nucleotide-binding universal stress UspA family protein